MMNWINKKRNKKGFTLVELVVVIAILGILAAIAVPKLSSSRENASIAAHNANVRTLESAATLAISEGKIPEKDVTIEWKSTSAEWKDYLQSWPTVPTGVAGRSYKLIDAEGEVGTEVKQLDSAYTVTIDHDGKIEVKPFKIADLELQ